MKKRNNLCKCWNEKYYKSNLCSACRNEQRKKLCSAEWCKWKHYWKWLCSKHYSRMYNWYCIDSISYKDKRTAIIEWDIAKIPLWVNAKDWYAIVDKEFAWLDMYIWHKNTQWYACTNWWEYRRMQHYIIWKWSNALVCWHMNHDKLDNRCINLKHITVMENSSIRPLLNNNTSWLQWVSYSKKRQKRMAQIRKDWKIKNLWWFESKEEAYKIYLYNLNLKLWNSIYTT